MKPVALHEPGVPADDVPPPRLERIVETFDCPQVQRCGLTTTRDGRWALYVTVQATASVPIADVEAQAGGFPVVYEAEPDAPPRARPAYPASKG